MAAPSPSGQCPKCGSAVWPADSFCESCGTELSPAEVSTGAPTAKTTCQACGSAQFTPDGYCESCGAKLPSGRDHIELDLGLIAGVTDRGLRHHRNEDAMALATASTPSGQAAVAVVCDGVSTSSNPDAASLAAAQAAVAVLLDAVRTGADLSQASERAVAAAQEAVAGLAAGSPDSPSATFVSAVMTESAITLCWLGDSRAYWLAPDHGASERLSRDDSLAEEMVTAGLLSEAEAMTSPQAHVVTRWVGADIDEAAPHISEFRPTAPGVLMLCSDGLWNYQPDAAELAGLALPAAMEQPLACAVDLVRFAITAGGRDNITVVLAPFPPAHPGPAGPPDEENRP